jgi:hypothetical protein
MGALRIMLTVGRSDLCRGTILLIRTYVEMSLELYANTAICTDGIRGLSETILGITSHSQGWRLPQAEVGPA